MDSRFHLKIEFEIYDRRYPWDCSLNWTADPGHIDRRITEWFLKSYEDAHDANMRKMAKLANEKFELEREGRERAELKRLKAKYPKG
jgi:hypothetical protein